MSTQDTLPESKIDVLLVDDEPNLLKQASLVLEKEDQLNIRTTTSAQEALELMENNDFDVIISDYKMPEIDGLEFLEIIRTEKKENIPFIIFTGRGREEIAMKALNLGANRYIQKGGDPKSQYGF